MKVFCPKYNTIFDFHFEKTYEEIEAWKKLGEELKEIPSFEDELRKRGIV